VDARIDLDARGPEKNVPETLVDLRIKRIVSVQFLEF